MSGRIVFCCIVNKDSMFDLKPRFSRSIVTTLAWLEGKSVGICCATGPRATEQGLA